MRIASTPNMNMRHSPGSIQAGLHLDREALVRTTATLLGAAFLTIGAIGFLNPGTLGLHLSPTHNVIHLASGAASLYFGLFASAPGASMFCLAFGILYGALAAAGFVFGGPEQHTMAGAAAADSRLLTLVPGKLELGIRDHMLHSVLGFLFLVAGVLGHIPVETSRPTGRAARKTAPPQAPPPPAGLF